MSAHFYRNLLPSFFLAMILYLSGPGCQGGKVLVVPLEGSHWVNMDILLRALHNQGHSITVVRSTKSWYIKEDSPYYDSITVPVAEGFDEEFIKSILRKLFDIERGKSSAINFISLQLQVLEFVPKSVDQVCQMATAMFEDKALMKSLNESQYDLVLTDPGWGAGIMLAHHLRLPLVYNVRWITTGEGHLTLAPSPISYIPITGSGFSDKMTFSERVRNVLFYLLLMVQNNVMVKPRYQAVCDKYLTPKVDYFELQQTADIWLMRVDFVFEFPRPTMPNVVYMGGFQCKPAKPLPQDLEDFVQSSGEHGVILMSLGTFVSELPSDITEDIAAAFAELPQKVIWKYTGERPSTLGNNTLLVDWMPQNDILGHPKIKLFVAHGGTNGVQEALYHGVPVVGIPLFFDQYDNLLRLKVRGGATIITISIINKNTFLQALQEVLHEPSYRENMQRLSRLHRDQPVKPLDRALFWIEFVMRHKGAAHLRTESYKMPWYAYHSVDVVLFLLAVMLCVVMVSFVVIRYTCSKVFGMKKMKHE
ncbi:UDP-glucuronosyltransferase 2B1-like [Clupea harengus]|uniref:UDP-glucuronosyltransferase n=1 Tax=Clupea harengus TaxID=7950 RepID=A0A8M1KKU3_CLUHA|nr:UDP-glucuronosyltransferase 2B1-like [Clupea harengus]